MGISHDSTMTCSPRWLVFASHMFLLALPSRAFSTNPNVPTLSVPINSSLNELVSHCYTPDSPGAHSIEPVDPQDCTDALSALVRTKDFTKRFRFSKTAAMAVTVPLAWQSTRDSDCRIIVSCTNDLDTAEFRLADVAQVAKSIIDNCVYVPDPHGRYPLLRWGGISGVSTKETFYVAVAKPIRDGRELENADLSLIETE